MSTERKFLLLVAVATAAATPAVGQDTAPAGKAASNVMQSAVSIPDFSGIWAHSSFPALSPPGTC